MQAIVSTRKVDSAIVEPADAPAIAFAGQRLHIEYWPIARLKDYERNPRKNDGAVERMVASITEFGFAIPVLARSSGIVVDGHLRLKAARKLGMTEVPVIPCDGWTDAQVKAFRLMVNRSVTWADLGHRTPGRRVRRTAGARLRSHADGLRRREIDAFTLAAERGRRRCPAGAGNPGIEAGDLWLLRPAPSSVRGRHKRSGCRPVCWTTEEAISDGHRCPLWNLAGFRVAGPRRPERPRRRRAELHEAPNRRATTRPPSPEIPEQTGRRRLSWCRASRSPMSGTPPMFASEVLARPARIGFLTTSKLFGTRARTVLTQTHYWFQHEPCFYVRKKNAPWFGKAGKNSTIWSLPLAEIHLGWVEGAEKYDHPTQKPVELMRRPLLNHTKRGELVYEPFLGSGTTLAAAELTERVCCGLELDPKYVDVVVSRWQALSSQEAASRRRWTHVRGDRNGTDQCDNLKLILPKKHGGARPGAGQPPYEPTPADRATVKNLVVCRL